MELTLLMPCLNEIQSLSILKAIENRESYIFWNRARAYRKYLRLEKLRFQNELEIVYDIQSKDFMLPSLSVQPLVV